MASNPGSVAATTEALAEVAHPSAGTDMSSNPSDAESPIQTRTLHLYDSRWHKSIQICRKDEAGARIPLYFAKLSLHRRGEPDVSLHVGPDASGEMLGVVKMRHSTSLHLCLGDPENHKDAHWEDMVRLKPMTACKFGMKLARSDGTVDLQWSQTRKEADGVTGWDRISPHNRRLVDASSGKLLAVFLDNGARSLKKRGKLVLYGSVDSELEAWIMLGAIAITEKDRRRGGG